MVGRFVTKGIFNVTTFENRLKMEQQENSFCPAIAVASDPLGQAVASLRELGQPAV